MVNLEKMNLLCGGFLRKIQTNTKKQECTEPEHDSRETLGNCSTESCDGWRLLTNNVDLLLFCFVLVF